MDPTHISVYKQLDGTAETAKDTKFACTFTISPNEAVTPLQASGHSNLSFPASYEQKAKILHAATRVRGNM